MYSGQGFLEAGGPYQMKSALESKLQVVVQNIESSNIYYLVLMWLLRILLFILWIGKCLLISALRSSFSLLRKCLRSYLCVALVGLTLSAEQSPVEKDEEIESRSANLEWVEAERVDTQVEEDLPESPLLPMVVRDRMQICEENLAIKDRARLLYEFDKVVAPEVSAFQLGQIVVPIDDTRQLATFLKLKMSQTCKSQSSAAINAAICGVVLGIRSKGATSKCVVSWERNHMGNIKHALVYIAAHLEDGKIHLVLVGRKVEEFLGSSEFRSRFCPPRTRGDKREWTSWTLMHLRSLREDAVVTAEQLLSLGPVHAQVW